MWKLRLLIVALALLGAWGGATALLLPEAVRRARVAETDAALRRAAAALPGAVSAAQARLLETARRAAEEPARAARSLAEVDAGAVVARVASWAPGRDWALLSREGVVLARSANRAKHGDSLIAEPLVRQARDLRGGGRLGEVDGAWRLAAAVPLEPIGDAPVRLLLATRPVDTALAGALGELLGVSVALAGRGELLAADLPSRASEAVAARLAEPPGDGSPFGLRLGAEAWRGTRQACEGLDAWLLRRLPAGPGGVGDTLRQLGLVGWERWGRAGPLLLLIACVIATGAGLLLPLPAWPPLPGWRTPPARPTDEER